MGNEHGQVLVSVLTAAEGHGLDPMAAGLMKRYREAGETAPKSDVCGQRLLQSARPVSGEDPVFGVG